MIKPQIEINPCQFLEMLGECKPHDEIWLSREKFNFWLSNIDSQIKFTITDRGDAGYVVSYNHRYYAIWVVSAVYMATDDLTVNSIVEFETPFKALDSLVDIVKIDNESLEDEAFEYHNALKTA